MRNVDLPTAVTAAENITPEMTNETPQSIETTLGLPNTHELEIRVRALEERVTALEAKQTKRAKPKKDDGGKEDE